MEADNVTLSDDEVRDRFSEYHEGDLPPAEADFVKKRLAEDAALAAEYDKFRKILGGLASLSLDTTEGTRGAEEQARAAEAARSTDLVAGVQQRLNKRSGGKFYRTRWSRAVGLVPLEAIATLVLVVLILVYVAMTYVSEMRSAVPGAGGGAQPRQSAPR